MFAPAGGVQAITLGDAGGIGEIGTIMAALEVKQGAPYLLAVAVVPKIMEQTRSI